MRPTESSSSVHLKSVNLKDSWERDVYLLLQMRKTDGTVCTVFIMFVMEGSRLNITYLCQVLKHRCKIENEKIVDECSSIVLV